MLHLSPNRMIIIGMFAILILLSCSEDETTVAPTIENLTVRPNPATTEVTISFNLNHPEKIKICICNRWGQVFHRINSSDTLKTGRHHYHVDISDDSPTLYLGILSTPTDTVNFYFVNAL